MFSLRNRPVAYQNRAYSIAVSQDGPPVIKEFSIIFRINNYFATCYEKSAEHFV